MGCRVIPTVGLFKDFMQQLNSLPVTEPRMQERMGELQRVNNDEVDRMHEILSSLQNAMMLCVPPFRAGGHPVITKQRKLMNKVLRLTSLYNRAILPPAHLVSTATATKKYKKYSGLPGGG